MSKFKIGDKVRVVCNTSSKFAGVEIGDVGVVVSVDNDEFPINLRIKEHDIYGFKEDELKLLTDCLCERPVAIRTKKMWIRERKLEILDAIIKCTKAEMLIPIEWAEELKELEEVEVRCLK